MCRLFGMTGGTNEVQATFWLLDAPSSLLLQSESQPDGVGLGTWNRDGSPRIYRKPVAATRSQTFIAGAQDVRSRTFLAHIRHASAGAPSLENTHPFEQHGRLMAHNGIVGDLDEIRRRLGPHNDLVHGTTDSELLFALMTKRIEEHDGDVSVTTATDLWALRYPESNELWILENSIGGFDAGDGFEKRSDTMRVQSGAFSIVTATVIASERMDDSPGWRMMESGELIHVDPELRVTSTMAVTEAPAHMIDLEALSAEEAATQAEPRQSAG